MKTLVFIDRDGTIIYDDGYYLGSSDDWKKKIKILPGVAEGIRKLNEADALVYMISNQSGIAMKSMPLLTKKRALEVCEYIKKELERKGAKLGGYRICTHINKEYAEKNKNVEFDPSLVKDCDCRKPKTGMIVDILKEMKLKKKDARIYVIGDRASDVQTALNAGGIGILIPSENVPGEDEKIKSMKNKNAHVMKNMEEVAKFITENIGENAAERSGVIGRKEY